MPGGTACFYMVVLIPSDDWHQPQSFSSDGGVVASLMRQRLVITRPDPSLVLIHFHSHTLNMQESLEVVSGAHSAKARRGTSKSAG